MFEILKHILGERSGKYIAFKGKRKILEKFSAR